MKSFFSAEFFKANRQKLREKMPDTSLFVITANGLLQRGGDSTYQFSQDANFWYLTGINEPDIVLVMDDKNDQLIVPGRSGVRETFDGAVSFDKLRERSGIQMIYDDKKGWDYLSLKLKRSKKVATVAAAPNYVVQYGFYTNPARHSLALKLKSYQGNLELDDAGQAIARQRMIKQPAELKAIQAAIDITLDSLKASTTLNTLSKYKYEYELEAEISAGFRKRGATGDSFEPVVASGKNACTLHNVSNSGAIKKGQLILADVGAEVEHYAADITRTYSNGKATKRQQAVHQAVQDVQQFALAQLKPGVLPKEYEQAIENFMGERLKQLKLIKTVNHENVRKYYPHSTSHFLGLNVHDVGDYTQPLQAGIVMTVEPGIYIPEESIGVRIEDDVLITKNGVKVLSRALTSDL